MLNLARNALDRPRIASRPTAPPALRTPVALDMIEEFGTTVTIQAGQEIHAQGDGADHCYRVLSGCVRTMRLMADGRRQVGEFLLPSDLLGFDLPDACDLAAEAACDTVLRRYPARAVEALADRHLALARRLRQLAAESLRRAQERNLLLGRSTATERVASFLAQMAARAPRDGGARIRLPMTRADIADHLGLTIETVCRNLTLLRRERVIATDGAVLEIRDLPTLHDLACSEPRH